MSRLIILIFAISFAFSQEIMVNVVGYEKSGPKRAVIQTLGTAGNVSAPDLARGKTATASRSEGTYLPGLAVDGSSTTRWSSYQSGAENNDQWISVDLGDVYKVDKVVLNWEAAYGKHYIIEVSLDESNWATVFEITNNATAGKKTHEFAPADARYVRMYGIERGNTNGGFSLYDFEVYGEFDTDGACSVVNSQGTAVHSAGVEPETAVPGWTGRNFQVVDFSDFKQNGKYKIKCGSMLSPEFSIGEKILQQETGAFQISFFNGMRNTDDSDRSLRIYGSTKTHNIYGGWWDATGDPGKHLSHLSYANYFNPQQIPLVVWALLQANEFQPSVYAASAKSEAAWGADYLLRSLSEDDYFYMSVFDSWGQGTREICAWGATGNNGARSSAYQSAMREGGGVSIAALARASKMGISGDSSSAQYLAGAKRAYAHLKAKPALYQDNGKENIIDDYTGLLAAIELYNATNDETYRTDAQDRVASLLSRQAPEGWFYTHKDNGENARPFYHAADEGLPIVALARFAETFGVNNAIRTAIKKNLEWYISISKENSNPFEYAKMVGDRFFMPHTNETGYWWQGENARIASLSAAFTMGAPIADPTGQLWYKSLFGMASAQLDWILGKNPFGVSMMFGFGSKNYPNYPATRALSNIKGGICNGITAKDGSESNLDWMPANGGWEDWRYIEQWLPHNAWYLTAIAAISHRIDNPIVYTPDPNDPSDPNDPGDPGDPNDPNDPGDPNDPLYPYDPNNPTPIMKNHLANASNFRISVLSGRNIKVELPFAASQNTVIDIYSIKGQKMLSYNVQAGHLEATIKTPSGMARGVYLLNVRGQGKNSVAGKIYLW